MGTKQPKVIAVYCNQSDSSGENHKKYCGVISTEVSEFKEQWNYDLDAFLQGGGVALIVAIYVLNERDVGGNTGYDSTNKIVKIDNEQSGSRAYYEISATAINALPRLYITSKKEFCDPFGTKIKELANNEEFICEKFTYLLKFLLIGKDFFYKAYRTHFCDNQVRKNICQNIQARQNELRSTLLSMLEFKKFLTTHGSKSVEKIIAEFNEFNNAPFSVDIIDLKQARAIYKSIHYEVFNTSTFQNAMESKQKRQFRIGNSSRDSPAFGTAKINFFLQQDDRDQILRMPIYPLSQQNNISHVSKIDYSQPAEDQTVEILSGERYSLKF